MKLSRPFMTIAVLSLLVIAFLLLSPPTPSAPVATTRKKPVKVADAGWDFPPPDPKLHFAKPGRRGRNPFAPLVVADRAVPPPDAEKEDVVQIPAGLAGGEANWAYTGMAEVDGVRMALLENGGSKKSGYVREGETWKKSRIVGISSACIVLADEKGVSETVFRFNPNDPPKVKPLPEGGFQPTGPIGAGLGLRPLTPPPPPGVSRPTVVLR